jgi:multiple sugar transport system permease protein
VLLPLAYAALGFFVLFPIAWIFLMSLKTFGDIIAYPPRFLFTPTLANYAEVLRGTPPSRPPGRYPISCAFSATRSSSPVGRCCCRR